MIRIIGHRGNGATSNRSIIPKGVFPENTLSSFKSALENKSDGIELDVYPSKDDIVVIHDNQLIKHSKRDGFVANYTTNELKKINLFHDGVIPTLDEVLNLCNQFYKKDLLINIEVKGEGLEKILVQKIQSFIEKTDFTFKNFLFNGFSWDKLSKIKQFESKLPIALNLKSKLIFGKENISMPGYVVSKDAQVSKNCFKFLKETKENLGFEYIDCVIGDLRKELLDFCVDFNLGISTSCPNERTEFNKVREHFDLLMTYKNRIKNIIFKSDDVQETLQIISEDKG